MNSPNHVDKQRVTTTDDTLSIYRDLNLNSGVIAPVAKGVEMQLEAATIFEGREWMKATLADGRIGYVLGPSVRGHTTPGGKPSLLPVHQARLLTVAEQRRQTILLSLGFCIATVLGCFGSLMALVPTQGMHGNEPFLKVFVSFSLLLMLIHAVTSALGLAVLFGLSQGGRLWAWGVGGFVAGAGLAGLLVTVAILSASTSWPMLLSGCWLPPSTALVTLLLKKERTA